MYKTIYLQAKFLVAKSKTIQMTAYIVEEEIKTCKIQRRHYNNSIERTKTETLKINVDANGYGRISLAPKKNAMKITLVVVIRISTCRFVSNAVTVYKENSPPNSNMHILRLIWNT